MQTREQYERAHMFSDDDADKHSVSLPHLSFVQLEDVISELAGKINQLERDIMSLKSRIITASSKTVKQELFAKKSRLEKMIRSLEVSHSAHRLYLAKRRTSHHDH